MNSESKRVAIHVSPSLLKMTVDRSGVFIDNALVDAFIGKMLVATATPEKADDWVDRARKDPYFESRFRKVGHKKAKKLIQEQNKDALFITQFQLDTETLVACLNVEASITFEPVCHLITNGSGREDIFVAFGHEDTAPEMKSWQDIKFDRLPVIPSQVFKQFIRILLKRLGAMYYKDSTLGDSLITETAKQELFDGTYLKGYLDSRGSG